MLLTSLIFEETDDGNQEFELEGWLLALELLVDHEQADMKEVAKASKRMVKRNECLFFIFSSAYLSSLTFYHK